MKLFNEAVRDWMMSFKKNSVKPSTYDRIETSFGLMEHYTLSSVPIDQLDEDYIL